MYRDTSSLHTAYCVLLFGQISYMYCLCSLRFQNSPCVTEETSVCLLSPNTLQCRQAQHRERGCYRRANSPFPFIGQYCCRGQTVGSVDLFSDVVRLWMLLTSQKKRGLIFKLLSFSLLRFVAILLLLLASWEEMKLLWQCQSLLQFLAETMCRFIFELKVLCMCLLVN